MTSLAYRACSALIKAGRYTRDDMMDKLDLYLAMDRITPDEYQELVGMMPEETATPTETA